MKRKSSPAEDDPASGRVKESTGKAKVSRLIRASRVAARALPTTRYVLEGRWQSSLRFTCRAAGMESLVDSTGWVVRAILPSEISCRTGGGGRAVSRRT